MEKTLDKESVYDLQKIDCNCNDCAFMVRDISKYKAFNHLHPDQKAASHKAIDLLFKYLPQLQNSGGLDV